MKLREDLNKLKIDITQLKIRERKAIHVAKAILLNNFGWIPTGQNYYAGDWMLGPNLFCWEPICEVFLNLGAAISYFKPRNLSELRRLDQLFKHYNYTFVRYIENLKLGVRTGYVRSLEACKVGTHNMHYLFYRNIALGNETGVYKEPFSTTIGSTPFFDQLSKDDNKTWKDEKGQDVLAYFNRSLLTYIGKPALKMLRYVEEEHLRNCPKADDLASGLHKFPLPYTWMNSPDLNQPGAWNVSAPTTKKLPTGEVLQGSKTYESFMRFFTTFDITPAQLREKAFQRLNNLYNKTMELVRDYTGNSDDVKARDSFISEIQLADKYFNDKPFPSKESDDSAFINCTDADSAKLYCPERWKAMQAWIKNTEEVKQKIEPFFKDLFYDDGPKKCIPKCPVEIVPWFHPHVVFHAYFIGTKDCSVKASQGLPFFTANYGPKWTEYTTAVHEVPGHHVEVQSFTEYFQSDCTDPIAWLNSANFFPAITEGWAAYNEYELFPNYTTLYTPKTSTDSEKKEILRQKYGMLYYQKLHALRPIADIDLNFYGKPVSDIRKMYQDYVWEDNNHQVNKDITRMQSTPGFVTSYMIGQMEISRVKAMAEKELGGDFSLKDFHYEILREGEFPLDYLEEHIKAYIACKKDPGKEGCKEFV